MAHYRDNLYPQDHRREDMFQHLADFFPNGSSAKRTELYITKLMKFGFKIKHVREGIERTIAAREQQSFPPLAVLVKNCREAQADDLRANRPEEERPIEERFNDYSVELFRQYRAEEGFPSKLPRHESSLTPLADEISDLVEL